MAFTLQDFKAMFPDDPMRTGLVDTFMEQSTILPMMYFIPNDGFTYRYGETAKLPGVGFRDINGLYADDAGVINPRDEKLVPFGGSVKTDQWMVDLRGGRARTVNVANKIRAAGLAFDRLFFHGDSSTDPQAFDGIRARINTSGSQMFWCGDNGGALTLDLIDKALDAVQGDNAGKVIPCSRTVRRKITSLLRASAGGATIAEFQEGQVMTYDGAKVVTLWRDNTDAEIFPFTETRGSSNVTSSLYVVRFGGSSDETGVQGLANEGLFKTRVPVNQGEAVRDVIEALIGIGVFNGRSVARVGGILDE